jgi:hypothetical protein
MGRRYLGDDEDLLQGNLSTILGLLEAAHRCYDGHPPLPTFKVVDEIPYIGKHDGQPKDNPVTGPQSLLLVGGNWLDGSECSLKSPASALAKENVYIQTSNVDIFPSRCETERIECGAVASLTITPSPAINTKSATQPLFDDQRDIIPGTSASSCAKRTTYAGLMYRNIFLSQGGLKNTVCLLPKRRQKSIEGPVLCVQIRASMTCSSGSFHKKLS